LTAFSSSIQATPPFQQNRFAAGAGRVGPWRGDGREDR
jgi:hypothetical protein